MPNGENSLAALAPSQMDAGGGEAPTRARSNAMTFDAEFLARLRRREPAASTWFVYTFTPILEAKLRYKLRDQTMVEDLRNDTFCRVLTLVDQNRVRDPAQFGSFVRGVCDNVIFEHIRKDKGITEWPEGFEPLDPMPPVNELLAAGELNDLLRIELRKLSGEDEKLITEIFLDERDRKMLAQDRGITVTGLNVKLCRSMKPLRESFLDRFKPGRKTKQRQPGMSQNNGETPNVKSRRSA